VECLGAPDEVVRLGRGETTAGVVVGVVRLVRAAVKERSACVVIIPR
jgi:hypothetical protein